MNIFNLQTVPMTERMDTEEVKYNMKDSIEEVLIG